MVIASVVRLHLSLARMYFVKVWVVLLNPVWNGLSEMLHVYKSEVCVLQFSKRNDLQNTGTDPAIENRRIVWTFMFEAAGRKVACENSRPSSLPARVAFHGCFRRLEGKRKVAFHTITDFTLLQV